MSAVPATGLRARWEALAARERRLVVLAAVTVSLVLTWAVLFEPAWRGRAKLAGEIQALRTQVAQLDALAAEARRLGDAGAAALSPQAVRDELERSVAAAGLRGSLTQLDVRADRIELRFANAPFPAWLVWFDSAQRSLRLRAAQVSAMRDGAERAAAERAGSGRVGATVVFELPRPPGADAAGAGGGGASGSRGGPAGPGTPGPGATR